MCRKDFTGYSCGHCSLPTVEPCPITLSNPRFPLCKYMAEFPRLVGSFCEPCQRVAFTQDVLLKEKIHMEEHQKQRCPCGNDFTEEERQQTRARLLREKERTKSSNWRRQEAYEPRKQTQGDNSQLNSKQKSGQQQQFLGHMGNLSQYLNAPYGQHPMLPVPSYPVPSYPVPYPVPSHQSPQSFHPYLPHHAFTGVGTYPEEGYSGTYAENPYIFGTNYGTGPVMGFEEPLTGSQESPIDGISNLYSAQDQPFLEDRDEGQDQPYFEERSSYPATYANPPAFVSSTIILPSRPGSCPLFESKSDWDTISR